MKLPKNIKENTGEEVLDILHYIQQHIQNPDKLKAKEISQQLNFQKGMSNLQKSLDLQGRITRVGMVPGLFYLVENKSQTIYGMRISDIEGYRGESAKELGLKVGAPVRFRAKNGINAVESAVIEKRSK